MPAKFVKFFKVDALPTQLEPDSLYFVEHQIGKFRLYVTDNNGQARELYVPGTGGGDGGARVEVGPLPPADPQEGDLWILKTQNDLYVPYVYHSNAWVALDSHTVDGYHASPQKVNNSWFDRIPVVSSTGSLDIGKEINFHLTSDSNLQYEPKLYAKTKQDLAIKVSDVREYLVAKVLTEPVTYYVSETGSDEYGDGSQKSPFKNIWRALDELKNTLIDTTVEIRVSGFTYEYITFKYDFSKISFTKRGTLVVKGLQKNLFQTVTGTLSPEVHSTGSDAFAYYGFHPQVDPRRFLLHEGGTLYAITTPLLIDDKCVVVTLADLGSPSTGKFYVYLPSNIMNLAGIWNLRGNIVIEDFLVKTAADIAIRDCKDITFRRCYLDLSSHVEWSHLVIENSYVRTQAPTYVQHTFRNCSIDLRASYLEEVRFVNCIISSRCSYIGENSRFYGTHICFYDLFGLVFEGHLFKNIPSNRVYLFSTYCYNKTFIAMPDILRRADGFGVDDSRSMLLQKIGVGVGTGEYTESILHSHFTLRGSFATQTNVVNTDVELDENMMVVLVDAQQGQRTITLPRIDERTFGRHYVIKKIDSSSNRVVVVGKDGQTIDGASQYVLSLPNSFVHVICGPNRWHIIGR